MFLFCCVASAQQTPAVMVAATAGKYANAVMENYSMTVQVKDLRKVVTIEKYRLTILNRAADDYAHIAEGYDDHFWFVNRIEGRQFNSLGKEIRRLKKAEIRDESAIGDGVTMADNSRVKHVDFSSNDYPYTIEVEIETESRQTYFLPQFQPQPAADVEVKQAEFRLEYPANLALTIHPQLLTVAAPVAEGNHLLSRAEVKELPARPRLAFEPPFGHTTPAVYVSANDFEMDGVKGKSDSWADLGHFQIVLNRERMTLPEAVKAQIPGILAGKTTDRDKVAALYQWMQQRTRYISIQLGIGGWQPMPAAQVSTKGYGDCKALSNYMVALLTEAGLPAHYVVVKAGASEANATRTDRVLRSFNHVIAMVPLPKDTIWLECTSQDNPPGHLGSFTDNRNVLVIKDDGKSTLVRTLSYTPQNSGCAANGTVTIDESGNLTATVSSRSTGLYYDNRYSLEKAAPDYKRRYRDNAFQLSEYDYQQLKFEAHNGFGPFVQEEYRLSSPHFAAAAGKRFLFMPNFNHRSTAAFDSTEPRTQPLLIARGSLETDSLHFTLPTGFAIEKVPPVTKIVSPFGTYESAFVQQEGQWLYVRRLQENEGSFPATDYAAFCRFYAQVARADAARAVMVKTQ